MKLDGLKLVTEIAVGGHASEEYGVVTRTAGSMMQRRREGVAASAL